MSALGARLKELRAKKELTQLEMAKILGLSQSTYALYETDKRQPDYETITKIADYHSVSTDYLLGKTSDKRRIEDLFIPNIEEVYGQASKMDLPKEFEMAFTNAKKLPISEQRVYLTNALMEYHNLPEEARSVILKIINSYSPS